MTAVGKLLALLNLVAGLAMVSWAAGLFVNRPGWYDPVAETVEKGHTPVTFKGLQAEIDGLNKAAVSASQAWGENLEVLRERERFRAYRKEGYAQRLAWAKNGNPNDPVEKDSPFNKGFYEANVIDLAVVKKDLDVYKLRLQPLEDKVKAARKKLEDAEKRDPPPDAAELARLRADLGLAEKEANPVRREVDELELTVRLFPLVSTLYDARVDPVTGLPRGKPILAPDGTPLPGVEKLLATLTEDVKAINADNATIVRLRQGKDPKLTLEDAFKQADKYERKDGSKYEDLGEGVLIKYTKVVEDKIGKMREIRDTVQAELFFLSTSEVNVYETRETVLRRERQLRARLYSLGIMDP